MKTSEHIERFLNFLRSSEELFRMAEAELEQTSGETQDILHRLELHDDCYHETAALAKKLREVRRRRREAKDAVDRLGPIVDWHDNNTREVEGVRRLLGAVRKIEAKQDNRTYIPRTKILEESDT